MVGDHDAQRKKKENETNIVISVKLPTWVSFWPSDKY